MSKWFKRLIPFYQLPRLLDIACLVLVSSVIMDSWLWITTGYQIPSWTMAAMSAGVIMLLQVIRRLIE